MEALSLAGDAIHDERGKIAVEVCLKITHCRPTLLPVLLTNQSDQPWPTKDLAT
jgi:hypothetical protein